MIAATESACFSSFASRSARSMEPSSAVLTTTTRRFASVADAAFVPCAEAGMRQMSRSASPLATWYARMAKRPASSPVAPEFGCTDTSA